MIGILDYGHPDYSSLAGLAQQTPVGQQGIPPFQLGASSGYRFTFMGKRGAVAPETVLRRAGLTAGESVLVFYGNGQIGSEGSGALDAVGLACIEALR